MKKKEYMSPTMAIVMLTGKYRLLQDSKEYIMVSTKRRTDDDLYGIEEIDDDGDLD